MISIKSKREIELLKIAGNIVYETHKYIKPFIKPGVSLLKLDSLAEEVRVLHHHLRDMKDFLMQLVFQ